ncbi:MAG: SPOR domain-containing protein [Candidatus Zixiibacteriota bacterium]
MRFFLILVFSLSILSGCGGSFIKKEDGELTGQGKRTEKIKYAALSTPDDKEIVPLRYPIDIDKRADSSAYVRNRPDSITGGSLDIKSDEFYQVYRIQLFSSNTYGPASREEKIAREVFDSTVYMDYEVPYYKIRVGNFNDRTMAENYLPAAKESGYTTAWVVKVAKDINTLNDIYKTSDIPLLIDTTSHLSDTTLPDSEIDTVYEQNPEN